MHDRSAGWVRVCSPDPPRPDASVDKGVRCRDPDDVAGPDVTDDRGLWQDDADMMPVSRRRLTGMKRYVEVHLRHGDNRRAVERLLADRGARLTLTSVYTWTACRSSSCNR